MSRIRNNQKRWRLKWPWRLFFPVKVDQRFCRECGLAYHEGPLPEATARYKDGNVEGLLYPTGVVHFGVWKTKGNDLFLTDFIPQGKLGSLLKVVRQALEDCHRRT